ncbi:DUF4391 domain-containing protein, partial [Lactobacillus delbrueckii subsp. bulgaricus]|nr:hypothetical protein [Lactobacillus delbrueckii subsp. bulgaricus]
FEYLVLLRSVGLVHSRYPQDYDQRIIEAIAKGNPHKLVFLMSYEDQKQLAVYYQKLYMTEWMPEAKVELHLSGDS